MLFKHERFSQAHGKKDKFKKQTKVKIIDMKIENQ